MNFIKLLGITMFCVSTPAISFGADYIVDGVAYNELDGTLHTLYVTYPDAGQRMEVDYSGTLILPEKVEIEGVEWSVVEIGENAFYGSNELQSISLPSSIAVIKKYSFALCNKLSRVNLPDGLSELPEYCFFKDENLTSVEGCANLSIIRKYAFAYCNNLETFPEQSTLKLIEDYALAYTGLSRLPNETDAIEYIGEGAFYNCANLKQLDLSGFSGIIGEKAFAYCSGLKNLILSHHLKSIPEGCFSYCTSLATLEFPEVLTEIETKAFIGCGGLEKLYLPNTLKQIGDYAFAECGNIREWKNENPALIAGQGAFESLYSLDSLNLKGIRNVEDYTFAKNTSLTTIEIGDDVDQLGNYVFAECNSLNKIYCASITPPVITPNTFDYMTEEEAEVIVKIGCKNYYVTDAQWSRFTKISESNVFPYSAVEPVSGDVTFYIKGKVLYIPSEITSKIISIYDLSGNLTERIECVQGNQTIELQPGTVIVSDGISFRKVLIP